MTYPDARSALSQLIRKVPDFPEAGVVFQDLTPVLADSVGFRLVIDELAERCERFGCDLVAGLDARGFLLGAAVAFKLGLGVLAVRKRGKLPPPVHTETYELEYGTAALEIPASGLQVTDRRVVLVDDVLATGGTLAAARSLIGHQGGTVTGMAVVLEVPGLGGRDRVAPTPVAVVGDGS